MTRDELAQIIAKSIGELGFARIAKPAVIEAFRSGEGAASFDIHDKLKEFASSQNLEYEDGHDDEDFFVFRLANKGE